MDKIIKKGIYEEWYEKFNNNEVWELTISGGYLMGCKISDNASKFNASLIENGDVLHDNGIENFKEKAKTMGLIPMEVYSIN